MYLRAAALSLMLIAGIARAGVSGPGSFDNEDALYWAVECTSAKTVKPVATALGVAIRNKPIEASEGAEAVAAAELVAAALGRPNPKLPSQLRDWIKRQSLAQLAALAPDAQKALTRIADPEISELAQNWSQVQPNKWLESIVELQARLQQQ